MSLWLPPVEGARPWRAAEALDPPPRDFTFALLSDRTDRARPGVFERAVEVVNWLHPDFVIQIGDSIEGYTTDDSELAAQWKELDGILAGLERPLFRVVGNHDVSNEVMRDEWLRRHGLLYYHFRYADVLFLVLDTSDPPQPHATDPEPEGPAEARAYWDSTLRADISDDQAHYFERVLAEHSDVRWTFVCMHIPAWQGDGHPALDRLYGALGERPYTMFGGHVHNYQHRIVRGRDHIRLGTTGGAWVLGGEEGNFDHVTLVRMTPAGPRIANLVLDGVLGIEGGAYPPASRRNPRR